MSMKRWTTSLAVLIPALALCGGVDSVAAGEPGGWQSEATMYGWYAGMDSEVRFPGSVGRESDVTVDASDIIDNMNMIYMGAFEARRDRWSIITDLVYLNLGDDGSTTVRIGADPGYPATASADLDMTSWVVSGGVGYDLLQAERGRLTLVGGVATCRSTLMPVGLGGPFRRREPVDERELGRHQSVCGALCNCASGGICPSMPTSAPAIRTSPGSCLPVSATASAGATSAWATAT